MKPGRDPDARADTDKGADTPSAVEEPLSAPASEVVAGKTVERLVSVHT